MAQATSAKEAQAMGAEVPSPAKTDFSKAGASTKSGGGSPIDDEMFPNENRLSRFPNIGRSAKVSQVSVRHVWTLLRKNKKKL